MLQNNNGKWYKIHLTNEQVVEGVHIELQRQFTGLWLKSGTPEDAAMFDDFGIGGEGINIYFSPGSSKFMMDIINQYFGEEVDSPNVNEVALLVGPDRAWDLFKNDIN